MNDDMQNDNRQSGESNPRENESRQNQDNKQSNSNNTGNNDANPNNNSNTGDEDTTNSESRVDKSAQDGGFDKLSKAQMAVGAAKSVSGNGNSSADDVAKAATDTAQAAVSAAKLAANAASGNVVGAIKDGLDLVENGTVQKVVIGIIVVTLLPIIMGASIVGALFQPMQKAADTVTTWTEDFANAIIHPVNTIENVINWFSNFIADDLIDKDSINVLNDDKRSKEGIGMDGENYEDGNFYEENDSASDAETKTMKKILDTAIKSISKRHKDIRKSIDEDFKYQKQQIEDKLKNKYPNSTIELTIDMVCDDKFENKTGAYQEAARLISLYNVQTDASLGVENSEDENDKSMGIDHFKRWLGTPSNETIWESGSEELRQTYKDNGWSEDTKLVEWEGEMLSMPDWENVEKMREDKDFAGLLNFKTANPDKLMSAVGKLIRAKPEIVIDGLGDEIEVDNDEGGTKVLANITITYEVESTSVDDIAELLEFDQLQKEAFDDTYNDTLKYYHIGSGGKLDGTGGSGSGGHYGSGGKLVEIARNEIGYQEKASNSQLDDPHGNVGSANYTKYGAWYGSNPDPWCAMFVSWCADQAGISTDIIPKNAGTSGFYDFFNAKGLAHSTGSGYLPKVGDLVERTPGSNGHIEIISEVDGTRIKTIGGNTSGGTSYDGNNDGGCVRETDWGELTKWTYVLEVPYPAVGGLTGEIYPGTPYPLSEEQISKLAGLAVGEAGDNENGLACVISHMANLHEGFYGGTPGDANGFYKKIYRKFSEGGWYADSSFKKAPTETAINLVRIILVEGNHVLPSNVTEFDMFPLDCAKEGDYYKEFTSDDGDCGYIMGETRVRQNPSRFYSPASGTVYAIVWSSKKNANIFYTVD